MSIEQNRIRSGFVLKMKRLFSPRRRVVIITLSQGLKGGDVLLRTSPRTGVRLGSQFVQIRRRYGRSSASVGRSCLGVATTGFDGSGGFRRVSFGVRAWRRSVCSTWSSSSAAQRSTGCKVFHFYFAAHNLPLSRGGEGET